VRRGLLAIPLYLCAVGVAHVALALRWYEETTGLPRDGQAFSGTMVLGAGFALLGAVLMPLSSHPTEAGLPSLGARWPR